MDFEELLDKAKRGDERAVEELLDFLAEKEQPEGEVWDYGEAPEGKGVFGSERWDRTLDAFRDKAEAGDTLAQYAVGRMYYHWGMFYESEHPDAYQKRIGWWVESYSLLDYAAEGGHADASYRLGNQAYSGLGCSDSREMAGSCYYNAASRGHEAALDALFELVQEIYDDEDDEDLLSTAGEWIWDFIDDADGVLQWYRQRAENGSEEALHGLTAAVSNKGSARAMRALVEMADAGHEGARESLQTLGEEGWDDGEHYSGEAPKYLREAANGGSEWGKKTYEAVLGYLRGQAAEGEDWAREALEKLEASA